MTGDIRQQLIEALDQAEELAKECSRGPWRLYRTGQDLRLLDADTDDGAEVAEVAQWTYGVRPWVPSDWDECDTANADHMVRWDPSTVLRLIGRERRLLDEALGQLADDAADETAQWHLDQLAAFWLGTPEVDR